MLREARDELAARARRRQGRLSERRAKEIISGAALTAEDMADLLRVYPKALLEWLAPANNADHREIPEDRQAAAR